LRAHGPAAPAAIPPSSSSSSSSAAAASSWPSLRWRRLLPPALLLPHAARPHASPPAAIAVTPAMLSRLGSGPRRTRCCCPPPPRTGGVVVRVWERWSSRVGEGRGGRQWWPPSLLSEAPSSSANVSEWNALAVEFECLRWFLKFAVISVEEEGGSDGRLAFCPSPQADVSD
jgi:hypothetical protein